jgi:uncharacterized membrane protein
MNDTAREIKEAFVCGFIAMSAVALLIGLVALGVFVCRAGIYFLMERPACIELSKLTGREAFISPRVSCMLKENGEWVDYRVVTEKKSSVTIKRESAK